VRRRDFVSLVGGAMTWPLMARAQQPGVSRIGALYIGNADVEQFKEGLRKGLRELGHIEGKDILFEFRSAEGKLDRLPALAADLVRLKVDVIVALYTPCAVAAKEATRETPIVMISGDPVEVGLVASLARPGNNVTGLSLMAAEVSGKCVELFRDMLPSARRVAVLGNSLGQLFAKSMLDQIHLAGRTIGIEIEPVIMISEAAEVEAAFSEMKERRADAVIVQGSLSHKQVTDLALEHRLPAASTPRSFAEVGGLMSYGADGPSSFLRSTVFVHKILKGSKPMELPVEQPTKFELVVNLKTARTIGLSISDAFLARADTIIE
jgi:putative tryptophan/tyrosine transport system substrate-binding protein